jgi:cobalt-zinc-cadmium efflux system membrane fusion protein
MEPTPVQDLTAVPVSANGDAASHEVPPHAAPPPFGWKRMCGRILRGTVLLVLLGGVVTLFLVLALGIELPGMASQEEKTVKKAAPLGVQLVTHYEMTDKVRDALRRDGILEGVLLKLKKLKNEDIKKLKKTADVVARLKEVLTKDELKRYQEQILARALTDAHTLKVPREVRTTLGILKGMKEKIEAARKPTQGRPMELPGSIALDPTKINRIRLRFAPAEVVSIGDTPDPTGRTSLRELRSGDVVEKGRVLATFYSVDVGNKKNDLFEAIMQFELDQQILTRAEANKDSVPEVFLLSARRNLQVDRSAINRAMNTLRGWGIPEEDIAAVHREARETIEAYKRVGHKELKPEDLQKATKGQLDRWARVVLKATDDCVIVERNVAKNELVVDPTVAVFQIANVNKLQVVVYAPEEDLRQLLKLQDRLKAVPWKIRTLDAEDKGLTGYINDISFVVDQNTHALVVKGYIDNPGKQLRGGQFITATIDVPPPEDVVEVPVDAVVDDGRQCVVFVETDAVKHRYQMRRVEVTHRYDKVLLVRSRPFAREEALTPRDKEEELLPRQALLPGERVLASGVLELKKELEDRESNFAK